MEIIRKLKKPFLIWTCTRIDRRTRWLFCAHVPMLWSILRCSKYVKCLIVYCAEQTFQTRYAHHTLCAEHVKCRALRGAVRATYDIWRARHIDFCRARRIALDNHSTFGLSCVEQLQTAKPDEQHTIFSGLGTPRYIL